MASSEGEEERDDGEREREGEKGTVARRNEMYRVMEG